MLLMFCVMLTYVCVCQCFSQTTVNISAKKYTKIKHEQ